MGLTVVGTVHQHSGALTTCIAAVKSIIMAATCSYSTLDSAIDAAAARLGYEEVKPEQREAVRGLVNGRDVFVALPTGFGKSLCYAICGLWFLIVFVVFHLLLLLYFACLHWLR